MYNWTLKMYLITLWCQYSGESSQCITSRGNNRLFSAFMFRTSPCSSHSCTAYRAFALAIISSSSVSRSSNFRSEQSRGLYVYGYTHCTIRPFLFFFRWDMKATDIRCPVCLYFCTSAQIIYDLYYIHIRQVEYFWKPRREFRESSHVPKYCPSRHPRAIIIY